MSFNFAYRFNSPNLNKLHLNRKKLQYFKSIKTIEAVLPLPIPSIREARSHVYRHVGGLVYPRHRHEFVEHLLARDFADLCALISASLCDLIIRRHSTKAKPHASNKMFVTTNFSHRKNLWRSTQHTHNMRKQQQQQQKANNLPFTIYNLHI